MQRKDIISLDGHHKVELVLTPEELAVLQVAMIAFRGIVTNSESLLREARRLAAEDTRYKDVADYNFIDILLSPSGIFAVKETVSKLE